MKVLPIIAILGLAIGLFADDPATPAVPMTSDPAVARTLGNVRVVSASTSGSIKNQEPLDPSITGESIEELCFNYLVSYFDCIPEAERPFHAFYPPSKIEGHSDEMEVRFIVLKSSWGYIESLKVRQKEDRWELVQIFQVQHLSIDSGDSYPVEETLTGTRIQIELNNKGHNK